MTGRTTAPTGIRPAPPAPPAGTHRALTRVSFRFSPDGTRAACLVRTAGGRTLVESWWLTEWLTGWLAGRLTDQPDGPRSATAGTDGPHRQWLRTIGTAAAGAPPTQPLPLDDGRVLLLRCGAGTHRLSMLAPGAGERTLGEYRLAGLRLLPCPGTGALAVAVGTLLDGPAGVWPVTDSGLGRQVASLPGILAGGCWLDPGRRLVVNQATGSRVRAVELDLRTGGVTPLPEPTAGPARVLLAAPASGLLLCLVTGPDRVDRFGWSTMDDPGALRTPTALRRLPAERTLPLAADPTGTRVAFQLEDAVRSRLAVFTPAGGRLAPVPLPPGCLGGVAGWSGDVLRVPFSAPAHPTGLARLHLPAPAPAGTPRTAGTARTAGAAGTDRRSDAFRLDGSAPPADGTGWVDARLERFAGPAGPVEALVYGDWRRAPGLVVALHGGPESSWRMCFEPSLQALARSGLAVIAPNQRGSTGYGEAHQRAIHGAWGGPDAADIAQVARAVRAGRGGSRLALFGASYGAYLALLVAAGQPDAWSRCAVVAPFLSGPRLHAEAGLRVRALVDRLDGHRQPVDVLRVAGRIRARLLLVHGAADPVIPVSQSRTLRQHLLALGRREPTDFSYLELPGGGHDPLADDGTGNRLVRRLCGFLAGDHP